MPNGSTKATPPAKSLPLPGTVWQATQSAARVRYSPRAIVVAVVGAPASGGAEPALGSLRFNQK